MSVSAVPSQSDGLTEKVHGNVLSYVFREPFKTNNSLPKVYHLGGWLRKEFLGKNFFLAKKNFLA